MNKIFALVLTEVILQANWLISPAFADKEVAKAICALPVHAASMAAGTVVGTPIAILRKTKSQYFGCLKEYRKDSNAYKFWGSGYSLIVAAPAGVVKGTVCASKNAIVHSVDKPFSKETFSLGKLENIPASNETTQPSNETTPPKPSPSTIKPESQPWGTPR
jgi:hypothetical protein